MQEPDTSNPWTTLASRKIYENAWIAVREDQVIRPDGKPGIYGVVSFRHSAVGVLPVDGEGRIWLVGQYRYPVKAYSWEIPEGGGTHGESPEETARRELREETGLLADHLQPISIAHLSNSVSDEVAHIFRATGLRSGPSAPEGNERIDVRLFTWQETWRMLQRNEITDSMSVIAILCEAVRRANSITGEPINAMTPRSG